MVRLLDSFPLSFTNESEKAAVICHLALKPQASRWGLCWAFSAHSHFLSHQPAFPDLEHCMALSAADPQLCTHKVIALNYPSWPHIGNHLHLTTPVFIISYEGCVGNFHTTTDLTLPWECYSTFMWCTKSFNREYTNTLIFIARGFQLLLSELLSLCGQTAQGSALRVPERVLGLSLLVQGHAVKTHVLGKSMRLLLTAEKIWQQKLSYTHLSDNSASPGNLGHSQCHCTLLLLLPRPRAWNLQWRGASAAFMLMWDGCFQGANITAPVYLPQTWRCMSDLWGVLLILYNLMAAIKL